MNTGAPLPSVEVAQERVLHYQRKLHEWASNDVERRFHDSGSRIAVDWTYWSGATRVGDVYALMAAEGGHESIPRRAFVSRADEALFRELLAAHLSAAFDGSERSTPIQPSPMATGEPPPAAGQPSDAPTAVAQPGEIAVVFSLDQPEAVDLARRMVVGSRRWMWATGLAVVGLFVAGLGTSAAGAGGTIIGPLIGWVLPVVLFVFFFLLADTRLRPRSLGRRLWSRGEERSQHFAEHGAAAGTDHAEAQADWGWFKCAAQVGDTYVLTTRAGDHWVTPRRAFRSAEAEQQYRHLVTAHIGTL